MSAELIAVGSEMLRFGRSDTNSDWLTARLNRIGIEVGARSVVDDDEGVIAASVATALERSDPVVLTGGLGPTEDDRTRPAIARALGIALERDPAIEIRLRARFERAGRRFTASQLRQAERPVGASWIDNPIGTAPGLRVERDGRLLFALPGVPAEMRAMYEQALEPVLRLRAGGTLATGSLRIAGRTEASVDEQLSDLYTSPGIEATILAHLGWIEVILRARAADGRTAAERLAEIEREMTRRLGDDLFGRGDDTLAGVVGRALETAGRTLATAESCTAGLLSAAITDVAGSSAWYRGGIVAYSDDLKASLAGVSPERIAREGAVSEEVARDLARGARVRCGADEGLGVTGIAGPSGGTPEKPVGLVHIALDSAKRAEHRRLWLPGDRAAVRARTVCAALDLLRRALLESA